MHGKRYTVSPNRNKMKYPAFPKNPFKKLQLPRNTCSSSENGRSKIL